MRNLRLRLLVAGLFALALAPTFGEVYASGNYEKEHKKLQGLYNQVIIDRDGYQEVDYGLLKSNASLNSVLKNYLEFIRRSIQFDMVLGRSAKDDLAPTKEELILKRRKKAFWINFYNACLLNEMNDHYDDLKAAPKGLYSLPPDNQGRNLWDQPLCQINRNKKLSLNQIRDAVLRNGEARGLLDGDENKSHRLPEYVEGDKRIQDPFDYRIHFALHCGSLACPTLYRKVFTRGVDGEEVGHVDEDLLKLESRFWNNPLRQAIRKDENGLFFLHQLFKNYNSDFEAIDEVDGNVKDYYLSQISDIGLKESFRTAATYDYFFQDLPINSSNVHTAQMPIEYLEDLVQGFP